MNIDYSVCNALRHRTEGMTASLVCYDVGCQWSINFLNRVKTSNHLSLPPGLDVISAVGKFHLGAHIPECFALYSLNFVDGAGQQDGEIIETLWSDTNRFSGSLRAMSKAHRHEVLDDIMRDSNWKKMVNMGKSQFSTQPKPEANAFEGKSLRKKWRKAKAAADEMSSSFEALDAILDDSCRKEWEDAEFKARKERGQYLRIYDVKTEKGQPFLSFQLQL